MRRLSSGVLVAMTLACASSSILKTEVPERGIALSWYDVETQRKRSELLADSQDPSAGATTPGRAVASPDSMRDFMDTLLGGDGDGAINLDKKHPGRLAMLDPRSGEPRALRAGRPGAIPHAVSPDGEKLLFTQLVGRYRQLYELDRVSGDVRGLTREPGVHPDGCFGPEERIVFVRAEVKNKRAISRIFITDPGGDRARVATEGPNEYAPACAPDGSAIAWVRNLGGRRDVLVSRMPPVDGEDRVLGAGRDPAFSPDGEWIVYSAQAKGRWQLHRVRADGTGRARIGHSVLDERQPSFSPDGRLVVYVADDGVRQTLYLRRFDGTGDRVLLDEGGGVSPIW